MSSSASKSSLLADRRDQDRQAARRVDHRVRSSGRWPCGTARSLIVRERRWGCRPAERCDRASGLGSVRLCGGSGQRILILEQLGVECHTELQHRTASRSSSCRCWSTTVHCRRASGFSVNTIVSEPLSGLRALDDGDPDRVAAALETVTMHVGVEADRIAQEEPGRRRLQADLWTSGEFLVPVVDIESCRRSAVIGLGGVVLKAHAAGAGHPYIARCWSPPLPAICGNRARHRVDAVQIGGNALQLQRVLRGQRRPRRARRRAAASADRQQQQCSQARGRCCSKCLIGESRGHSVAKTATPGT